MLQRQIKPKYRKYELKYKKLTSRSEGTNFPELYPGRLCGGFAKREQNTTVRHAAIPK